MTQIPIVDMPPRDPRPGWNRSRIIFLAVSLVSVVALLAWSREVLLPFVMASIIAYVLTPLVDSFEKRRVPRAVAILVVYALTGLGLYLTIAGAAPRVYDETVKLTKEMPALADALATKWGPRLERRVQGLLERVGPDADDQPSEPTPAIQVTPGPNGSFAVTLGSGVDIVQQSENRWRIEPRPAQAGKFRVSALLKQGLHETFKYAKQNALDLIKLGQTVVSRVTRGIFLTVMTLMLAGYMMHTRDNIMGFLRSLPPPRARPAFDRLMHRMDRGLSGVVRGQLLICLVNGILSAIGFWLFGLKYWPILAIIAAVMSLIPIFGSILSTIPAVLIGLTQDTWTAVWVLIWIVGIHQVEANILNPNIIGVAAKIHPVLVVFALLVGEHFFGLWGALLAVPVLSLGQSLFQHFRFESMPDVTPDSLFPDARATPSSKPTG